MAESNREEIAKLEALYASNPGGRVFVHLAEACRKGGEHERARSILDEGLARHSDSASGYVVLGRVLSDLGEKAEAADAFSRVLELDPGNLIALRWLGDSARDRKSFVEAAAHYRDLLARSPNDDSIRELLAGVEAARETTPDSATHEYAIHDDATHDDPGGADGADDAAADGDDDLAPISPYAAAPGRTDDGSDESVEFGDVDPDSLPGDLASFANLAHGGADTVADDDEDPPETDIASLDWSGMGDVADDAFVADLDTSLDSGFAEDSLSPGDGVDELNASPLDVHALDAAGGDVAPFEPPVFEEPAWAEEIPVDVEEAGAAGAAEDADFEVEAEIEFEPEDEVADGVEDVVEAGDRPSEPDPELAAVVDGGPDEEVFELLTEEAELEAAQAAAVHTPPVAGLEAGGYGNAVGGPIADLNKADDGLHTETIAELYTSQGFHDRAAEVYRTLLRRRPGDERLEARLAESEAAMRPPVTGPSLIEEDESGEVWLSEAGSAWTGASDDAAEPSPYGWTESGDDGAAAPPIRSYLQALIGWRAEAALAQDDEPSQPAADAAPADVTAAGEESTSAAADVVAEDSGGWTPADIAAEPWAASSAPATSAPPTVEQAEPPAPAAPPTPAARVEPAAPAPVETPAPPRRSGGDPVEDAFLDWYGDGSAPAAPAAPAPAEEPAAAPGPVVPARPVAPMEAAAPWEQTGTEDAWSPAEAPSEPAGDSVGTEADTPMIRLEETSSPAEETSGESDEDLEMFRTWLQSLKK